MNRSGIITLLTDFGLTDAYTAMMKGVILSINKNAKTIDITHNINTGAIFQAAGLLKETYRYFPEGTVHVAVVDPGVGSNRRLMAFKANNHFFVGPDNGIFCPVLDEAEDPQIVELTEEKYFLKNVTNTFHGREVFAPAAAHISLGVDLEKLGPPLEDPVVLSLPKPYVKDKILYGQVIRIDNFGNIITNITEKHLKEFEPEENGAIQIGDVKIVGIKNVYNDVEEGELLAILNSSNLLEIAVNLGRATEYIGIDVNDIVGSMVKVHKSRF